MKDSIKVAAAQDTAVRALGLNPIACTLRDAAEVAAGSSTFLFALEHRLRDGQPLTDALKGAVERVESPHVAERLRRLLDNAYRGLADGTLGKRAATLVPEALAVWLQYHGCRLIEEAAALRVAARVEGEGGRVPEVNLVMAPWARSGPDRRRPPGARKGRRGRAK